MVNPEETAVAEEVVAEQAAAPVQASAPIRTAPRSQSLMAYLT